MRRTLAFLLAAAIAACLGLGVAVPAAAAAPAPDPAVAHCDVLHGLTLLDREHRNQLHRACVRGSAPDAALHSVLFRLVSSPGWHAGVVRALLHHRRSLTSWAEAGDHEPPPALAAQAKLDAGLTGFAAGTVCAEQRRAPELEAFLTAVGTDEAASSPPFTSRFATCLGVPAPTMEGVRLLTIRADGLREVTVVMGTPAFVHARRFTADEALHLGNHRFVVVAVPHSSPVLVLGTPENEALPVIWRGVATRNVLVWGAPPRRSCLDLSVRKDARTHLYLDGIRVDGGPPGEVCSNSSAAGEATVDLTLPITLDRSDSGLPDHEIVALTCDAKTRRPVVRHASSLPATAPAERLRPANVCEALRLDLRTPAKQRVAVLGVSKLPGCEATPMWASDLEERVRHVLSHDVAHQDDRVYADFSAYAQAAEALSSLESRMGRAGQAPSQAATGSDTADALVGTAAQEAWRQGIDTLLSLAVQCTPLGNPDDEHRRWTFSMRATAIDVSEVFARGYHERDGLDLEGFIDVEGVSFDAPEQQDAAIGMLLDRVFEVAAPRFAQPAPHAPYRTPQTLRVSRLRRGADGTAGTPDAITVRFRAFEATGHRPFRIPKQGVVERDRPRPCEGLVHRGARPPDAMQAAYPTLPGKERSVTLERNNDDDVGGSSGFATIYEGRLLAPRPGWYLVTIDDGPNGQPDDELDDGVCIHATAPAVELWLDVAISGGPLAYAKNGSRAQLYLRPRVGWTRYFHGRWLGAGVSLGYGLTDYAGRRSDWADLDVSSKDWLRWQRHAVLLMPYIEVRSRTTALPVELRARLGPMLDAGLVSIDGVSDELTDFRAGHDEDTVLDPDLDLGLDLGVGAPLGPVQLQVLMMLAYMAVDDPFARSGTTVTQDANLYMGFGFAIGGGRR